MTRRREGQPRLAFCALLVLLAAPAQAGASLDRPADPVVLTGAAVPGLAGVPPAAVVAFRYSGGWQQVPVQVDERAVVDLSRPYNQLPTGFTFLAYTDPGTYTGPDHDPALDADDEIVLMARDTGEKAPPFSEPANVLAGTGQELLVTDPLGSGEGYAYLFRGSGDPGPGAGQYVSYEFSLLNGAYPDDYNLAQGPNPESSTASTAFYQHHFSDRWIDDELRIRAGSATGEDILDRHRFQFAPGNCFRTEDTFSAGEGSFIVNKAGPVRAIRAYMGANSGPYTERRHFFYQRRHDITTFLRVHQIGSAMDLFDYSPAATGMTFEDDFNTEGVTINGSPDDIALGQVTWETVDGHQGALSMSFQTVTDIPDQTHNSYYLDERTPSSLDDTCTGDGAAYGVSGPAVHHAIPSTDPTTGGAYSYRTTRFIYYDAPGTADGPARSADGANPLEVTVTRLPDGYPRPKAATPTAVPLVPAYRACTLANRTHGAPLAFPSCSPPAQESSFLTVGSPDANGAGANSAGSVTLNVREGDGSTAADEADVMLSASVTDVRLKDTLADYGGETLARVVVRITDRSSVSPASDVGPATVSDVPFSFPVPCAARPEPSLGATCAVGTSADAVYPGAVIEDRRSIWQLGQVRLLDGGADGLAATGPNAVFARQGLFLP